jgi:hypothetical protein
MDHIVQFFDIHESLGASVARFVHEGIAGGETALIVVRPGSLHAIAGALRARGLALPKLVDSGSLIVRDAAATMATFTGKGQPRADEFDRVVGAMVRALAAQSARGLRVYGEMVDILAAEGNFHAAATLETLWNQLGEDVPFRLLCGYTSAHFATTSAGHAHLRSVCDLHSHVQKDRLDVLGNWLLKNAHPLN